MEGYVIMTKILQKGLDDCQDPLLDNAVDYLYLHGYVDNESIKKYYFLGIKPRLEYIKTEDLAQDIQDMCQREDTLQEVKEEAKLKDVLSNFDL